MKSIFTKIVLWSFSTLVISLIAFAVVTRWVNARMERDAGPFPGLQAFELAQARKAFESGGSNALADLLRQLNTPNGPVFYLLSGMGKDLATGEDRSELLRAIGNRWKEPVSAGRGIMIASRSDDGKYRLLMIAPPLFNPWRYIPYYGLILFAVALLCWPLAMNIGAPLRTLAAAVDRFGQGDLSVRLHLRRKDEIGVLAESFDRMADRLETLLVAERRLLQDVSHELRSPLARLSFA
ncbi:MAG: HAMP domain-containing protein, partial [Acidobacteriota bacterium]|nr:HAMP domain-containing protein [Acidobacteriota bacterium]